MQAYDNLNNDAKRKDLPEKIEVLDVLEESDFDNILDIASCISCMPISCVSLVDSNKLWLRKKKGAKLVEKSSDSIFSFEEYVPSDEPVIIEDIENVKVDKRQGILVKNAKIRFLAVFPINKKNIGFVGALCIFDEKPNKISKEQIVGLTALSRTIVRNYELKQDEKRLSKGNVNKSKFLASMSHEIRTPLNAIIGMTELLLYSKLTPNQQRKINSILYSGETLLQLINDILDLSKIESGKMELEQTEFNIVDLVEKTSEVLSIKAHAKSVEFIVNYPLDMPSEVVGDPTRVKQILYNIISNAIKFTDKGLISVMLDAVKLDEENYQYSIYVTDTGVGISDERINMIFNEFEQEDVSTNRKYGGSGLGLPICKSLCEMMSGSIECQSSVDKGSVFNVKINLKVADPDKASKGVLANSGVLEGLKILVVDDSEAICEFVKSSLEEQGAEVVYVTSSKQAISKLGNAHSENKPFHVVLLDYVMPEIDGLGVSKVIKNSPNLKDTCLIMMTAFQKQELDSELKKIGFSAYITKPIRVNVLTTIMQKIKHQIDNGKEHSYIGEIIIEENKDSGGELVKFPGVRILLVEDSRTNAMVAKEFFNRLGCAVNVVGDGKAAVDEFKIKMFDIVFMDCNMPVMDGYEATRIIKNYIAEKRKKITPIIAFTASAMLEDKQKCYSSGMDDCVEKPARQSDLTEMLAKWLH